MMRLLTQDVEALFVNIGPLFEVILGFAHGLERFFAGRQKAFPGTVPSPKGEARKSLLRVQPDRWVGPTLRKEPSKTK